MVRLRLGQLKRARVAFEHYVVMEKDPQRRGFVEQAQRELAAMTPRSVDGGPSMFRPNTTRAVVKATFSLQMVHLQRMLDDQRYASAQTLAERLVPDTVFQAVELAMMRAQVFVARGLVDEARDVLWSLLAAAPTSIDACLLLRSLK